VRLTSQITASKELQDAFNNLVSSSSQRGLLATIKNETLVPLETLQANGDFRSDLSGLSQHLSKDEARYILLKQDGSAADGYVAVTYVPDTANVRQKMLFASTRLTLVRELGVERFRETVFCTTADELTPEGWDRHEKHNRLDAPLTEEEAGLKHIKETEALESGGTGGKSLPSAGIALNLGDEVSNALESLKDSREGSLVMIVSLLYDAFCVEKTLTTVAENRRTHRDATPRCLETGHPACRPQLRNQLVRTPLLLLQLPWSTRCRFHVQLSQQEQD
jgi:twinfilin-like protein